MTSSMTVDPLLAINDTLDVKGIISCPDSKKSIDSLHCHERVCYNYGR
jgi:hypothetical protein